MLLCGKCKAAAENGRCPLCGKTRTVRESRPDDMVYLTSCQFLWSRILEDALKEAGITFFRHGSLRSGLTVSIGDLAEVFRYYVNCPDYEKALAVLPPAGGEMSEEELNRYLDGMEDGASAPKDEI